MSDYRKKSGKEKLLAYHKKLFRTPENVNHYSPEDYELAERRFLKYFVLGHEAGADKKFLKKAG